MDDIFAVDDTHVEVVSRHREYEREPFHTDDHDQDMIHEPNINARESNGHNASRESDDEFNFDYIQARPRVRTPEAEPFDLGLDDEVVIKKRAPQAKLDDERLLGPQGIPKIRDDLRKKIRFRGKGHELQDLGKFLELYQFWAHELFPKAKFRDAVKMIGKVGKSKKMKAQRRQIITDMLPRPEYQDPSSDDDDLEIARPQVDAEANRMAHPIVAPTVIARPSIDELDDEFALSDFDETFIHNSTSARPAQGLQGIANDIPDEMPLDEVDDLDDADALEAMGIMI